MASAERLCLEVAYATPSEQEIVAVEVEPGTTVAETIRLSGILQRFPEIDLARNPVGVFGKTVLLADVAHDGERIEIYRALRADPKTARRLRARRQRETRQRSH